MSWEHDHDDWGTRKTCEGAPGPSIPLVRRALRKAAGASQSDIAEVVGVTRKAVGLWEAGTRMPRGANLDAYLEVLQAFKTAMSMDQ